MILIKAFIMIYKTVIMSLAITIFTSNLVQASYYNRLAIYSKQVSRAVQAKTASLIATIKTYDTQKLKKQVEESLKDTVQQAEIIEPMIQESLKDASRKSIHMNKAGLFGKAESVVIENVQINHHGSKSFAECFFHWLKTGGQKRVATISLLVGTTGGYVIGSQSKQQVQAQPQIVIMPAP